MSEKEKDREKTGVLTTTMEGVEAVSKEEIEEILKKVDKEATARKLIGASRWISLPSGPLPSVLHRS